MDFDPELGMANVDDDDDEDLEAELLALQDTGAQKKPTKPKKSVLMFNSSF